MLHFLLRNHQSKKDLVTNIASICKFNRSVKSYTQRFYKEIGKNTQQIRNTNWRSKTKFRSLILLGGCGFSVGLIKNKTFFVNCESNSLVEPFKDSAHDEDIKFNWEKFWYYLQPYTWEFITAVFAALAVAFFNIRIPNLLGDLVNILANYTNIFMKDTRSSTFFKDIRKPAVNLFMMYILQSGFTFLYILLLSKIGEKIAARIRQDLFKQIVLQDIEFFDENRTGKLINRLTTDVHDFKSCFKQFISQGLRSGAQLIGGVFSLFIISPYMAGVALVSVPAVVVFMSFLGRTLRKLSKNAQDQSEYATAVCEEALSNIRTVRSNAAEYYEIEQFKKETDHAALLAQQLGYGIAIFQALTNFFLNGLVLSTLLFGGLLMSKNNLSPGQLMAFLVASQSVQRSLSQGSILLGTMIRGLTAGSRIFDYLSICPKVNIYKGVIIPSDRLKGEIRFENVYFSYPSRPEQEVLTNFNLVLKPGQTVALVGASGSGKSTVAALLERFYEPNSGAIVLDGYDLRTVQPCWLHSNVIGLVEQQPTLFATTISENIRYGKPNSAIDEVMQVAKMSLTDEFARNLPESYETNVGEKGSQLSGGQKQRIAIARALIKKPIILVLDEATSALDATSEAIVQKALDTAVVNKTTLVIAHRLSTIKNADVIVVLDKGRIVEMGKHDELMEKQGLYHKLVRQQEKKEQASVNSQDE